MLHCQAFSTVLASIPEAGGKLDEECSCSGNALPACTKVMMLVSVELPLKELVLRLRLRPSACTFCFVSTYFCCSQNLHLQTAHIPHGMCSS